MNKRSEKGILTKRASKDALFRVFDRGANRLLLLFLLGSIVLFVLYPILCIFLRSLHGDTGLTTVFYAEVWRKYRTNLQNSVFVGVWTSLVCTFLSVSAALCLSTRRKRLRAVCTLLLLITMVSPPFISSLAYIQLYGRRGWITYRLLGLTWDPYNRWGVIWMQSISFVPLNALFLRGILAKLDADSIRSAQDLGASPADILRDVVLPLMRPGIFVCLLLSFVRSLSDFETPTIIGGRFSTIASEIYLQLIGYSDLEKSSAMNLFLLLPSVAAFFLYRYLMRRCDRLTQSGSARQEPLMLSLFSCGPSGWLAAGSGALFFLMMILQYACIFATGFLKSTKGVYHFTLEYLRKLLQYDRGTMLRSIEYALTVSLVGTLFAMLFSYYMQRRSVPGRSLFDCLVTLPYMLPGSCFGIGYILAFHGAPFRMTGTALIVLANMLFKQIPTTTKICSAALTQVPPSLECAARDLGGGRFAVLRDVIFPSLRPAFFTCFAYHFSASMTTAGAILFLINPGRKLAVFKLFDCVYIGEYATAALIASWIIVTVLMVEGIVYFVFRKAGGARVF